MSTTEMLKDRLQREEWRRLINEAATIKAEIEHLDGVRKRYAKELEQAEEKISRLSREIDQDSGRHPPFTRYDPEADGEISVVLSQAAEATTEQWRTMLSVAQNNDYRQAQIRVFETIARKKNDELWIEWYECGRLVPHYSVMVRQAVINAVRCIRLREHFREEDVNILLGTWSALMDKGKK